MKKDELRKVEYTLFSKEEHDKLSGPAKLGNLHNVQPQKGLFIGLATDSVIQRDNTGNVFPMHITTAVIERQDGTIIKIKPENVRFTS